MSGRTPIQGRRSWIPLQRTDKTLHVAAQIPLLALFWFALTGGTLFGLIVSDIDDVVRLRQPANAYFYFSNTLRLCSLAAIALGLKQLKVTRVADEECAEYTQGLGEYQYRTTRYCLSLWLAVVVYFTDGFSITLLVMTAVQRSNNRSVVLTQETMTGAAGVAASLLLKTLSLWWSDIRRLHPALSPSEE